MRSPHAVLGSPQTELEEQGKEPRLGVRRGTSLQILHVIASKSKVQDVVQEIREPRKNRELAAEGALAEEVVKDRFLLVPARLPIGISHGQLIEIILQNTRPRLRSGHGYLHLEVGCWNSPRL